MAETCESDNESDFASAESDQEVGGMQVFVTSQSQLQEQVALDPRSSYEASSGLGPKLDRTR